MTAVDAALSYASRGWVVFPCHEPVRGGGCSCGRADCASPAKHPRTRHGLHDATTDEKTIAAWWRRWPTANVALRTGAASDLVVVDVDPAHGGDASLARVAAEHGPLPPTLTVATGGGGRHFYFTHPGSPVRNSAGALGPGLDLRGDGGYVVAPPSRHITGGTYQWQNGERLAAIPGWLQSVAPPEPLPRGDTGLIRHTSTSAWAERALSGEIARVHHSEPGRRNSNLNRAAFALGQLVAAGHLDADVVHDLLTAAGLAVGLGIREVGATVRSGLDAGGRHPRHPAERVSTDRAPAIDLRTIDLSRPPEPAGRREGHDTAGPPLP